jgi:hypothetical protein
MSIQENVDQMLLLHPKREYDGPLPPPRQGADAIAISKDDVRKLITAANTGASAGPSGLSADHLTVAMVDDTCLQGICDITSDILKGAIHGLGRLLLIAATSIGSDKEKGGIRPLAIGEIYYKLAAKATCGDFKKSKAQPKVFKGIQLGCGAEGGCERATHIAQTDIARQDRDCVVISTDKMNAYNMDCRMKMMQAVNNPDIPRKVAKFAHWSYHSDVPLLLMEGNKVKGVIPSETGPRQGCPAGGLLWNISNQPAYEQALQDVEDVRGLAITDDFVIFGKPESAFRAHARYEQSCKDEGHVTVPDKGFVLWPYYDRPCPLYIRRLAEYWGLELRVGATKLWGTYVGDITAEQKVTSFMQKKIKKYDPFFERLMHPNISRHHASILLRTCLKLAPTYWARTVPPDLAKPAMQEFDRKVWQVVTEKLLQTDSDTDLGREATTKILTPILLGGIGIRPMEMICDPGFMAAWLEAMPSMKNECLAEHDFQRNNALYPNLREHSTPTSVHCPRPKTTTACCLERSTSSLKHSMMHRSANSRLPSSKRPKGTKSECTLCLLPPTTIDCRRHARSAAQESMQEHGSPPCPPAMTYSWRMARTRRPSDYVWACLPQRTCLIDAPAGTT